MKKYLTKNLILIISSKKKKKKWILIVEKKNFFSLFIQKLEFAKFSREEVFLLLISFKIITERLWKTRTQYL